MRPLIGLLAASVFVWLAVHAFAGGDDAKNLQGTWEITELIVGGKPVPAKKIQGLRFQFKDDKLTVLPTSLPDLSEIEGAAPGAVARSLLSTYAPVVVDKRSFTFKIDASKKPAAVDLTALDGKLKGSLSVGIYELKGDTLRWCQSDDEKAKERPKDLKSPEKSALYLFTFKRVK